MPSADRLVGLAVNVECGNEGGRRLSVTVVALSVVGVPVGAALSLSVECRRPSDRRREREPASSSVVTVVAAPEII